MDHRLLTLVLLGCAACTASEEPAPGDPPGETSESEPVPVKIERWLVAPATPGLVDAVERAMAAEGGIRLPRPGEVYLAGTWREVVPRDDGGIDVSETSVAMGLVHVGPDDRVLARPDGVFRIGTQRGTQQPGDVYASGAARVPLDVVAGENLVIAIVRQGGGAIEVLRTGSEVVLNAADLTRPDLIAGASFPQWIGLQLVNLEPRSLRGLVARVVESDLVKATSIEHAPVAPRASTQVSFRLEPRTAWPADRATIPVDVEVASADLGRTYRRRLEIPVVAPGAPYRRTRISDADGSTQYYAVLPPTTDTGEPPGLILSLHGAAVEAMGQAQAYSPKDWAYLIAPTNRRPFGFDWEEWGRVDAIEALADAMEQLKPDPARVHLTGHSMGGHGTWHVGVHFSPRFGVIAPSAGWVSFFSYGGGGEADFRPVYRARAASDTLAYVDNLRGHPVYVIHGDADDNVPVTEARTMLREMEGRVEDVEVHFERGAGHWWDVSDEPGADCVDWEPMIARMRDHRFDPLPLSFEHVLVSPWVNPQHSFVTVRSEETAAHDVVLRVSSPDASTVEIETDNVRSMVLDGAALVARGVTSVVIDGTPHDVGAAPLPIGPSDGKNEIVHGPINQVFHRPFCLVWDDGDVASQAYASYLLSSWSLTGNGHGCGLPLSQVDGPLGAERNLVYVGVPHDRVPGIEAVPISWDAEAVYVDDHAFRRAILISVFPARDRLHAVIAATAGMERDLLAYAPFSSRTGLPDFAVIARNGAGLQIAAGGFYDPQWQIDPAVSEY